MSRTYFALILTICLGTFSCSYDKEPHFVNMKNVKVTKLTLDEVKINANALYYNPNDLGCELVSSDIDVYVDDIHVGKAVQSAVSDIKAKSNFEIPLNVSFSGRKILKDKGKILQGIANVFGNKEVNVKYAGTVTLDIVGVEYKTSFDYTDKLPLKIK